MENKDRLFEIDSWLFTTADNRFLTPPLSNIGFDSIPVLAEYLFAQLTVYRAKTCFAWIGKDRIIYVGTKSYVVMSHQFITDGMKRHALDQYCNVVVQSYESFLKGGSNV